MKPRFKSREMVLESLMYKQDNILIASIGMSLSQLNDANGDFNRDEIYEMVFDQCIQPNQHLIFSPTLGGYKLEKSTSADIENHATIDNYVDMVFCPSKGKITESRLWTTFAVTINVQLVFDSNSDCNRFKLSYGNLYLR